MKLSTLMFASLMTLTSAAAFAEGGSERSKEFYQNFSFIQQQTHGAAEQRMASADGKTLKVDTVNEEQPNS
ncbi:hypothetical protein C4K00_2488 [Pseudomonas synxantha]|uniref:Secreted protein n=2 Tax=Pseudomonas fluorescens group TaxID=136843 RepID=A0ABR5M6G4_9PSED|nr:MULTISPECIES: hypothetical protein [Pseudomonas]AKA86322.1 hypothetical protein VO64_5776 [Pseudomonas synxantha]AMS21707.1 hypothetical protein AYK59_16800 [Pseudomonas synxantha]AZE72717.1 hypothetical protein C4K00_2488 [Pseudomonas synxantha]KPG74401.1 hypothetical protein AEQ48_14710 [Pseudomonas libanensis]KRA22562.1 hypothetical protein ASD70_19755 [Pseudomonas sp. Root569]